MNIPKYRAYNKRLKIMMPVLQIDLDPEHGGVFVESKDGSYCGCRLYMELWPWDDIELMQWIGLCDAHDTDLYEGDIVQLQEDATAKIVFWGRPPEFGLDFYHNQEKWCEDWNLNDDCYCMDIIGNIWENSDLLPQEQSL